MIWYWLYVAHAAAVLMWPLAVVVLLFILIERRRQ